MPPTTPPAMTIDDGHSAKRRRREDSQQLPKESHCQQPQCDPADELEPQRDPIDEHTPRQSLSDAQLALHQCPSPQATLNRPLLHTSQSQSQGVKTILNLGLLQIPVSLEAISTSKTAKEKLPDNILPLYTSIRSVAMHHKAFIPAGIRSEIEDAFGDDAQEYWFQANRDDVEDARRDAELEYKMLLSLQTAATKSKTYRRYKDAWNAEVHLPILKLVMADQARNDPERLPEIAAELVTSATIAGDSVPRLNVLRKRSSATLRSNDGSSVLACSVSIETASLSSASSWERTPAE